MEFIIIIYTTNKLTVVEMEDIRGVRLRKFKLRKIVLGVRMHFHHRDGNMRETICEIVAVLKRFIPQYKLGPYYGR